MSKKNKSSIEQDSGLSPLAKSIVETITGEGKKKTISVQMIDPFGAEADSGSPAPEGTTLVKSVLNLLNGPGDTIERLAFETDPANNSTYQALYRNKLRLLPNDVLKRIAIQDDLIASICNARSNQLSAFGRPQPDRFSTGYKIEPEPGLMERMSPEDRRVLQAKIAEAELRIMTCGRTKGYRDEDALTFGQFIFMTIRNACVFGSMAVEAISSIERDGKKHFHSFRPIDAGTIYRAAPMRESAVSVRHQALNMLQQLKNKKIAPERYVDDEYAWVQVIAGKPVQAFTAEECLVHNFYPVTDVELGGYPLTPIDTIIAAVTMHINITSHNKLYFQSGRAARGMIVIKSDDIDDGVIKHVRQQFQASINSTANAWRTPVFGVGTDDDIGWYPIDNSSRDMEFQYLSDTNARVILSAFQMSPEELSGYNHLSKGTNSQSLSEGNNEYKLEAARDTGIRPMLAHLQNFMNARILPLIDEELSKICTFKFVGLDADTAEKENVRLQGDMAVHMCLDEVLEKVEKKPVGKEWGGQFLLNPQWQAILDKYVPVGAIMEHFFNMKGAAKDPRFDYIRDPFYFNQVQLLQAEQAQAQAQQQQQEQAAQAQQQGQQPQGEAQPGQQPQQAQQPEEEPQDLTRSLDQLSELLGKSESQLPTGKRRLLAQQRKFISKALEAVEAETQKALKEILDVADKSVSKKG